VPISVPEGGAPYPPIVDLPSVPRAAKGSVEPVAAAKTLVAEGAGASGSTAAARGGVPASATAGATVALGTAVLGVLEAAALADGERSLLASGA
jgi:hypothetical protein